VEIDFAKLEKKWQDRWVKEKVFEAKDKSKKPKFYVLGMFPYPSGDGLHMGHALNYSIGDVFARYKIMKGFNVLHPMGYDALGLPAENAAIKAGVHPRDYTSKSIKNFTRQFRGIGISYDWSRMVSSADSSYYKWDQWIFLKMFEKGLAYQKEASVNWCPKCNTVLANEQVVEGKCWRHEDTEVEIKKLKQWFLKITDYADELYEKIDELDWPEKTKAMQKNWIGKSHGTEIDFEVEGETQVESVEHFRKNININSKIIVKGRELGIKQIVKFRFDDGNYYMKLFLDEGYVLADDLDENSFILVKEVKTDLKIKEAKINYRKKNFNFVYSAHAVAEEVIGEKIFKKGESESFTDYLSKDNSYLSLGILDKNKQRLDFFGEVVGSKDIQIINNKNWPVFTTRPDTIYGVTFMVASAQHPKLDSLVTKKQRKEVDKFLKKVKSVGGKNIGDLEKEGVFTGSYAVNPANGEKVPIYAGNFVVADYGSGMVMAVPAHDQRDYEFAKKYGIEVKQVISPCRTDKNNPPVKGKKTKTRRMVHAIVKDGKKVLCVKWKKHPWTAFVVGGVDDGENIVDAARREVLEETGYKNLIFEKVVGTQMKGVYFAAHKDENRVANTTAVIFKLKDDKREKVSQEELEKHEAVWLDVKNINENNFTCAEFDVWMSAINGESEKAYTGEGCLINSDKFDGLKDGEANKKITDFLIKKKLARKKVNFKLRDWGISRQRYWGTPIPIIHCEKCGAVPVSEKDLPIELPRKVKFGKGNPLEAAIEWKKVSCPKCEGDAVRETDTMDTFVNSSWYFLRYTDPKNDKRIFDQKKAKSWCPIDQYIGGAEHACMHLIYFRFYTKFLRDLGLIDFDEPAKKLFHQGMLHGEGGIKMSKSKGNVVNPETVSKKYGIDTARFFLLSLASPDKPRDWNEKGIVGSLRFVKKIFSFYDSVKTGGDSKEVLKKLNKTVKNVGEYYERFEYRKATIELRELFEVMEKSGEVSKDTLKKFLKTLSPICPHITEELWERIGGKELISISSWPEFKEVRKEKKEGDLNEKIVCEINRVLESVSARRSAYAKEVREPLRGPKLESKRTKKVYVYVMPFEIGAVDEKMISDDVDLPVKVFVVNDSDKYDPKFKARKAKPGKASVYLE